MRKKFICVSVLQESLIRAIPGKKTVTIPIRQIYGFFWHSYRVMSSAENTCYNLSHHHSAQLLISSTNLLFLTMRIALFEPDIPQNTGTILRLAACLGVAVDIIEPAGFAVSDRAFRRAGLDYLNFVDITRHQSFRHFHENLRKSGSNRLVVLSTKAEVSYIDFEFSTHDTLLLGRESSGLPQHVHDSADTRIIIPMRKNLRSINIAAATAMVTGEALRQTGQFPDAQE